MDVWAFLLVALVGTYFLFSRYSATVGGDSYTYIKYARLLADGQATIEGPVRTLLESYREPMTEAVTPVWNTAMLPDGRWVYTVAPGYPLLLAILYRAGGGALMMHANVLLQLGVLIVFFLLLTQSLRDERRAGWTAVAGVAILMAMNIRTQHQFTLLWREPWIFLLLLTSAAAYARLDRHPGWYWPIPFLLGLACAVKESSVLYAGWMGVALLWHPAFRGRKDVSRAILLGAALFLIGCAPLLIQNWAFTGRPWLSLYVVRETGEFSLTEGGAGLSAGNTLRTLGRYVRMYQPFASALIPLFLLALWGGWRYRGKPITRLMAGWLALHVGLYLQWGNAEYRHMYFANYPVVFFAALGLHDLFARAASRLRFPALAIALPLLIVVGLLAWIPPRHPPRAPLRYGDWRELTSYMERNMDADGVILVNRPLRDALGAYTDLGIIRFHELIHTTGRDPVALMRDIVSSDLPVYFIDAPDRDPASIVRRANMAAMDWKYILQGSNPEPLYRFTVPDRRLARFLGRSSLTLYRLVPWSRYVDEQEIELPFGGASFLSVNPRGLEADLLVELNGEPVPHDFQLGPLIPAPGLQTTATIRARSKSGGLLPDDLEWALIDWETPIVLSCGADALPDDAYLFPDLPEYQPVQARRRFYDRMDVRVPVREGPDVFSVVQLDFPHTHLEDAVIPIQCDGGRMQSIPISRHALWIPLIPLETDVRRAGYRTFRADIPEEQHVSVSRIVSRAAWRKWRAPPAEEYGEAGLMVSGALAAMSEDRQWRLSEGGRRVSEGRAHENPVRNPFAWFLPMARAGDILLEWDGAGLMDVRTYPVDRDFHLAPDDPLARPLTRSFHGPESDDRGAFRWTGPEGHIRLPFVEDAPAYRLRLRMANHPLWPSNRVDVVIGDKTETVWVDPEVRTYEWVWPGLSSDEDWVEIEIRAEPWSPADYGSRDTRTLGIRWYGVEWTMVEDVD